MDAFSFDDYWSRLPTDYQKVVKGIADQLSWDVFNAPDADFENWGGDAFWDYIYSYHKSPAEQRIFRDNIDKISGVKFETIKGVSKQGLKEQRAKIAFCYSAFIQEEKLKTPSHKFLLDFFDYLNNREERHHLDLDKYDDIISKIKEIRPFSYLSDINLIVGSDSLSFDATPAKRLPTISERRANKRFDTPSSLLKWNAFLTHLEGRKEELAYLENWWKWGEEKQVSTSCLLIHGEGGVGKTRLAAEFAQGLNKDDWTSGFINLNNENNHCIWQCGNRGILLIIDYPEEQSSHLERLLTQLNTLDTKGKQLRILLLSRNYDYVHKLGLRAENLFYPALTLPRLSRELGGYSLLKSAWQAITDIKREEKGEAPDIEPLPLTEEHFDDWLKGEARNAYSVNQTPLMILALAYFLAANEHQYFTNITTLNHRKLIRYLTEREVSKIKAEISRHNQELDSNDPDTSLISTKAALLIKALAAISKGFDAQNLNYTIEEIQFEKCQFKLPNVMDFKSLSLWEDGGLQPLEPDILAADFFSYVLEENSSPNEISWIFSALGFKNFRELSKHSVIERLQTFGKLIYDINSLNRFQCADSPCVYWEWPIKPFLAELKELPDVCKIIAENLPQQITETLRPILIVATESCLKQEHAKARQALHLMNLGQLLFNSGEFEKAKIHLEKASGNYNSLAKKNPHDFDAFKALSFLKYSNCLSELGETKVAYLIVSEAIRVYRKLVEKHPLLYLKEYALAYSTLSNTLSFLGRLDESVEAINQSIKAIKYLSKKYSVDCQIELAEYRYNLANRLIELNRIQEGANILIDVASVASNLSAKSPEVHEPFLAQALNDLGASQIQTKQYSEGLLSIEKAISIRSYLAKLSPKEYQIKWSRSLFNLASLKFELGHYDDALSIVLKVIDITKPLVKEDSTRYVAELARAYIFLYNLRVRQQNLQAALSVISESVRVCKLAENAPKLFLGDALAASQYHEAECLYQLGKFDSSKESFDKAMRIYFELSKLHPQKYGPVIPDISDKYRGMFGEYPIDNRMGLNTRYFGRVLKRLKAILKASRWKN